MEEVAAEHGLETTLDFNLTQLYAMHSLLSKRKRRDQLSMLTITRVAHGGDKESFTKLVNSLED